MLKLISCGTTPMQALAASSSRSMSWPNTRASPAALVHQRGDDADQRGLARAVGAEQREEIALLDVEVDALQRLHAVLVDLGESAYRECIHERRIGGRARERKSLTNRAVSKVGSGAGHMPPARVLTPRAACRVSWRSSATSSWRSQDRLGRLVATSSRRARAPCSIQRDVRLAHGVLVRDNPRPARRSSPRRSP